MANVPRGLQTVAKEVSASLRLAKKAKRELAGMKMERFAQNITAMEVSKDQVTNAVTRFVRQPLTRNNQMGLSGGAGRATHGMMMMQSYKFTEAAVR